MQIRECKNKSIISFITVCILSFLFILIGNRMSNYTSTDAVKEDVMTAKVLSDIDIKTEELMDGMENKVVIFQAEITSGGLKGKIFKIQQNIDETYFPVPKQVEIGDKILVSNSDTMGVQGESLEWYYVGPNRIGGMVVLVLSFFILILLIGKIKGITTVVSLIITIASIFYVYIPSILSGKNIYVSTCIITVFIILSSLIILNGLNKKTLCAIVGNVGGIFIAGVLALFVNSVLEITGMVDQEYMFLTMLENSASIDLRAVVWGGILIGSLGAIMDVSMSIASAMQELSSQMRDRNFINMVHSGMNIGRDAIGTMTNTLILAYVGSSLAIILLFTAYNRNLLVLINFEMIVVEIIQSLVGSIGILLAVPVTVLFAAWIFNKKSKVSDLVE
jgi:uncharacterized membrane protein